MKSNDSVFDRLVDLLDTNFGYVFEEKAEDVAERIIKSGIFDVRQAIPGKWIWDDEGYHCSECFYHAYGETAEVLSGHWHYCPNCGVYMREESHA